MRRIGRPFQRRGWRAFRMIVLASYIARYGGLSGAAVLRMFGLNVSYDPAQLPRYFYYPLLMVALYLADTLLVNASSMLQRRDLATWLKPLEMPWPPSIRKQVWQPAYADAEDLYYTQPRGSSLRLKNAFFLAKMAYMIADTLWIMLLVRPISKLLELLRRFWR